MKKKNNNLSNVYQRRWKAALFGVILFVASGLLGYFIDWKRFENQPDTISEAQTQTPPTATPVKTETALKESAVLSVPFTVQAPYANWNIHEESCEEAAVLMYYYYLSGKLLTGTVIPKDIANQEMINMKNWEVRNYGSEPDLSIEKLGKFANDYYGLKYRVIKNGTAEDIKKEISVGNPVLAPVITHALHNPNYGVHPSYHILLIKGYRTDGIITNDSGVSQGENYFYSWDILFSAIDAQTPQMNQGRDFLVFTK